MERNNANPIGVALLKARTPWRRTKPGASHEGRTRYFIPGDRAALLRLAYVVVGLHCVAAVLLWIAYAVGSDLPV